MKKDCARRSVGSKHATVRLWKGGVVMLSVMTLLGLSGWFAYRYQHAPDGFPRVAAYIAHSKAWIAKHRMHLHQEIEQVKTLAVNKPDAPPPIHFEFYTALPHMQVKLSDVAKKPGESAPSSPNAMMTAESMVSSKPMASSSVGESPAFDADQLQRVFKEDLQKG